MSGSGIAQDLPREPLVGVIAIGVQEADRDRLDAFGQELARRRAHIIRRADAGLSPRESIRSSTSRRR